MTFFSHRKKHLDDRWQNFDDRMKRKETRDRENRFSRFFFFFSFSFQRQRKRKKQISEFAKISTIFCFLLEKKKKFGSTSNEIVVFLFGNDRRSDRHPSKFEQFLRKFLPIRRDFWTTRRNFRSLKVHWRRVFRRNPTEQFSHRQNFVDQTENFVAKTFSGKTEEKNVARRIEKIDENQIMMNVLKKTRTIVADDDRPMTKNHHQHDVDQPGTQNSEKRFDC